MTRPVILTLVEDPPPAGHGPGLYGDGFLVTVIRAADSLLPWEDLEGAAAVVLALQSPAALLSALQGLTGRRPCLPVICLTASPPSEEMALLEAGAALCLPKDSTAASVAASLQRLTGMAPVDRRDYRLADLHVDLFAGQVSRGGRPLELRPIERDILLHLARRGGAAISRAELQRLLWPGEPVSASRLAVHMHHLRAALDDGGGLPLVHTEGGGGYILAAEPPKGARRLRRRRPPATIPCRIG